MQNILYKHLQDRHVDFKKIHPLIDEVEQVATFLLYNFAGQIIGKMQYRPFMPKDRKNEESYGKYYIIYNKAYMMPVFGLEFWNLSNTLFVCEGIFDAIRFISKGYSAIAVFTTDPKPMKRWLQIATQNRKTVAICDAGEGGIKLSKYAKYYEVMQGDDAGAASDETINDIIERWK